MQMRNEVVVCRVPRRMLLLKDLVNFHCVLSKALTSEYISVYLVNQGIYKTRTNLTGLI